MRAQPVHVVYGGANLFKPDTPSKLGRIAMASADQYGPVATVLGVSEAVAARVLRKLQTEPVEDYRIDFEDGYGYRTDAEEDGHAESAGRALKECAARGMLPPFSGVRIKPLNREMRGRGLRTLDLFLRALGAPLPPNFVVTLPKPVSADEPALLAERLEAWEREAGIDTGTIRIEIMIETPQALQGDNLLRFAAAGRGRVRGAHFGPFDYTSSIGIASAAQDLLHPACDMARHAMQVAYAPAGIWLSDGPTNVMPVPGERGADAVHDGWRLHYKHVRRSLYMGFYQGWDLHPAQLVSRYAAVYSFYAEALPGASARLKSFVERASRASMVGQTFDDAASGQGLLNLFLRAIHCGALTEEEARERTGLTLGEIASGSFARIVEARGSTS
jgi:citrate lyase beta subunit